MHPASTAPDLEARVAQLEAALAAARPQDRLPRRPRRLRRLGILAVAVVAFAIGAPLGAIASHQFTDVSNANPFHGDIDALVDAGITSGCGGGKFCPSASVTREQMAAFLNRLGALASDKTPVVNADRLDGLDSTAFSRAAYATARPDECFQGTGGNECSIYNVKGVASIRRLSTGYYCVTPAAGTSFAGRSPVVSTDDFNSGPSNGFGVPIVGYSSATGACLASEVRVMTYRAAGTTPTISLSNNTSFSIVVP